MTIKESAVILSKHTIGSDYTHKWTRTYVHTSSGGHVRTYILAQVDTYVRTYMSGGHVRTYILAQVDTYVRTY